MYRFARNLKLRVEKAKCLALETLTATELNECENAWVKEAQSSLTDQKSFKQIETELGLYTDEDGAIRCRSRIPETAMEYSENNPALLLLLLRDHQLIFLVIEQCHKRVFHGGVRETLIELRTKFWVSKGRQAVKQSVRKCVSKRYEGTAYPVPKTAALPSFRIQETPPFAKIGIDFAGPLYKQITPAARTG